MLRLYFLRVSQLAVETFSTHSLTLGCKESFLTVSSRRGSERLYPQSYLSLGLVSLGLSTVNDYAVTIFHTIPLYFALGLVFWWIYCQKTR